jgi:hypothetical protein
MRPSILLCAALPATAILLLLRDELHAGDPHRMNRLAEPVRNVAFGALWKWGCLADD